MWRTIDLSQLSKYLKTLSLEDKKIAVLTFLQKYASHSTKRVTLLGFATNDILRFLRTHCVKLEGILLYKHSGCEDLDLALLSSNLKYIGLRLPICSGNGTDVGQFAGEKPFYNVHLLNLHGVQITQVLCNRLMLSESLSHLMLFHCAFHEGSERHFMNLINKLNFLGTIILAYCWFSSVAQIETILSHIACNCIQLNHFDFRFPYALIDADAHEIAKLNFDVFLESMDEMAPLRIVSLTGITSMTASGFEVFLQQHNNIEILELSLCSDIDDDFIYSIATNLKQLKSLQLSGCDSITNVGLKFLAHHPKLDTLKLACGGITGKAIQYTVGTLPKIRCVSMTKVHGYKKCAEMLKSQRPELEIILPSSGLVTSSAFYASLHV